jgi:hypothetical protein
MAKRGKHSAEPLELPAHVVDDLRAVFCSHMPGGEEEFEQLLGEAVEQRRLHLAKDASDPEGVGFLYHEVRYANCPQAPTGRKTKLSETTLLQIIHRL